MKQPRADAGRRNEMRYRRDPRRGIRRVAVALAAPLGILWLCGLSMGAGSAGHGRIDRIGAAADAASPQARPAVIAAAVTSVATARTSSNGRARAAIEWLRFHDPRERVTIGTGGIAIGAIGALGAAQQRLYPFPRRERAADVGFFAGTYAPFRARTADGELAFLGRGAAQAGETERRMILEWARLATLEAEAGPSASEVGLALAWHRGATSGGICDDLAVYLSGEVRAGNCFGGGEVRGRLEPERLARLYRWFDTLKPFQSQAEQGERSDLLLERLVFAGRGAVPSTPHDTGAMGAFASALYHQLTSRTSPPAATGAPGSPSPAAGSGDAVLASGSTPGRAAAEPAPRHRTVISTAGGSTSPGATGVSASPSVTSARRLAAGSRRGAAAEPANGLAVDGPEPEEPSAVAGARLPPAPISHRN
jgi:hypothetical protein